MKWLVCLLCLCACLLGGCWDRVEINDIALVTAAAIDLSTPDVIELSVQVFIPRSVSEGNGSEEAMTIIRTEKGDNIADAMSKVQLNVPRKVFWGHCRVYIYGEALARHGLNDFVDFFARHPEPRNRAYVFVSKGKARDILQVMPPLERYPAEVVRKLSDMHVGINVTLLDLQKMFAAGTDSIALPMVELMKPPNEERPMETNPYLSGTAVFRNGKMIGTLSAQTTKGLIWLRDEAFRMTVTGKITQERGLVTFRSIREKTRLKPRIEDGRWKMLVEIDTVGFIVQNGTRLTLDTPEQIAKTEAAMSKEIESEVRLALQEVQKELQVDILNFARQFHRKYPKEFAAVRENWNQVFSEIEVDFKVKVNVRRTGLIAVPAGLPNSDVKR